MRAVKILCTGDLHLGRVSSKYGPERDDVAPFTVRAAWARLVECAIAQDVGLVLISGDIADDGGNRYEAMGPFEAGVARLTERGIHVYLVAGNHDARTLPQILRLCSHANVHLLGQDGCWEAVAWPPDAPRVNLLGWSHPAGRRVNALPLEGLPQPSAQLPTIAVAHTDYRGTGDYAAVRVEALRRCTGVDLWLLGHIHAPELLPGSPIILNPGSPQALDPGEPGVHGPWLVEIVDGAIACPVQLPLSSVAYAALEVDITGLGDEEELVTRLLPALQEVSRPYPTRETPRLSCRVTLTGRTALLQRLHADRQQLLDSQPLLDGHGIYLEQLDLTQLRPDYDLPMLATRADAIGNVARLLRGLDAGEDDATVRGAADLLRGVVATVPDDLCEALPDPAALLRTECGRLLDALLRQEEARV